jgi:hypothetical protein
VAETKEAVKAEEALATENKGTVEEAVEKAQASKAGQLGELEGGAAAGTGMTRVSQNATRISTNLEICSYPSGDDH